MFNRVAITAACFRLFTSGFLNMLFKWFFTLWVLMRRQEPICPLVRLFVARPGISCSLFSLTGSDQANRLIFEN